MSSVAGLVCKACGTAVPEGPQYVCPECFGPLEVAYAFEEAVAARGGPVALRRRIEAGPPTLWRYRELLPVAAEGTPPADLGTGFTALLHARRLGERLGLKRLYLKNDATNPTGSFKDRVVSVAVTKAREFGFDTVACASTGNLAGSLAAHAARAGLSCAIFIPVGLERAKVLGTAVFGPALVEVEGTYDEVNRLAVQVGDRFRWGFVNVNLRPYYSEGSKTLAYETAEQLGWRLPDHVVVPIAGGSVLSKIARGFSDLSRIGLVAPTPVRVHGAQAEGCAPVVRAFRDGARRFTPVVPDTLCKSLAIGNPADGNVALETIRRSDGLAEASTDPEIVAGIRLVAETEGIFTETAGGVVVAVLKKLVQAGALTPDDLVVAYLTGNGLKTLEALEADLPAEGTGASGAAAGADVQISVGLRPRPGAGGQPETARPVLPGVRTLRIPPDLAAFEAAWAEARKGSGVAAH